MMARKSMDAPMELLLGMIVFLQSLIILKII